LIVAIHDLHAEHGLCCAGEGGEGEEGTFLKFAIKHLLPLDMKLKSNLNSSNIEAIQHDEELYCPNKTSKVEPISNTLGVEMGAAEMDEISAPANDGFGGNFLRSYIIFCRTGERQCKCRMQKR
jgi:calcineurin-binding protein cabin-1